MTSATPETLAWLKEQQVLLRSLLRTSTIPDLALALKSAEYEAIRRNSTPSLYGCVSTSGGHLDHQLVVLGLLATWAKTGKASVRVIENDLRCALAADQVNSWQLSATNAGKKISLVLCQSECEASRLAIVNSDHQKFTLLGDGISNIIESDNALVRCEKGCSFGAA